MIQVKLNKTKRVLIGLLLIFVLIFVIIFGLAIFLSNQPLTSKHPRFDSNKGYMVCSNGERAATPKKSTGGLTVLDAPKTTTYICGSEYWTYWTAGLSKEKPKWDGPFSLSELNE
ncbi:MAG: hypothetical protein UT82_C0009G0036 [Parcubacteria group bacterium GW2011_GWB1_40_14]|nr:MAG: hypothetical protein UT82_C0009G0036 [Parcubacteria group bacterium GW2011_GWB1_40_14]